MQVSLSVDEATLAQLNEIEAKLEEVTEVCDGVWMVWGGL
jgi:hypothetical protein